MTCREVTDILSEFVAGEMAPETAATLERHLSRCANCAVFLTQFRQTVLLARTAGARVTDVIDAPDDLINAVMAAIKSEDR